ncbi:E3 ubiquitin-protein ligase bre1 [Friedmanniomyces endolithicus]|nr:E3 ubiquitin-protein ligase bre1 [Friedmanniomyces endolithicus]
MTALRAPQAVALPSHDKLKMDERKRSLAVDADDLAPRARKLLKDENGQPMRMDAEKEKDLESFQKDAIMRQMKDYKRQKKDFEDQYNELSKKTRHHNDHLRIIDAWFTQLLDEIRILARQTLPTPPPSATATAGEEIYGSALLFENSELFSQHLKARSQNIRHAMGEIFGRAQTASPEVEDLRRQLNDLLAKEKEHAVQLRGAMDDRDSLEGKWAAAVERYMMAEKKLDRAKSAQVLKLERQAVMGGNGETSSPMRTKNAGTPVKSEHADVNGELANGTTGADSEAARREALVVAERQKAQVEEIEAENERLTNELSAARTKLASLSDDDYVDTSMFKGFKSQYEDVITRIDDLEATNIQLREEAQKLQAERTSYRRTIDEENRESTNDTEAQIARAETDLARIRSLRDEIQAELEIRKRTDETRRTSADQARELAEARDSKITALESETERLRLRLGDATPPEDSSLDDLDQEGLKMKLRTLESQHSALCNELSSMELAWKKTSALASLKVSEAASQEELVARLQAEKAKADQKYFAAMKAKDMKEGELRTLRAQNSRSSEIVTQLKDTESKTRELLTNLERQVAESKELLTKLEQQHRVLDQKAKEAQIAAEGLKKQVEQLKALVAGKDKETLIASKAKRDAEVELEKCQVRLEESKKLVETLRKTRAEDNSASSDDWRKLVICPACNEHIRNTVIKLCGHVFCSDCVQRLISNRSRKCPSCGRAFGNGDYMSIVLT